jgi:excinuclease ABC subunit A
VGTITEIYGFLRLCFMHVQQMPTIVQREKMVSYSDEQIKPIVDDFTGKRIVFLLRSSEREKDITEVFQQIAKQIS